MKKPVRNVSLIDVALKSGIDPIDLLKILSESNDHIKQGYKGNFGRERCIRKDGSFDYIKMSELFHSGEW